MMTEALLLDFIKSSLHSLVFMSILLVLPALLIGLIVSIFQAATQISEQTLSFLPKLLVTLLALNIASPWILLKCKDSFEFVFDQIASTLD